MIVDEIRKIYDKHKIANRLDRFEGVSVNLLKEVEENLSVILPNVYKEVMLTWGPRIDKELVLCCGPVDFYEMQAEGRKLFQENSAPGMVLPEKTFIFSCCDESFAFFIGDGFSENPEVFTYYYEDDTFRQPSESPSLIEWYINNAKMSSRYR